jgi:hypothetical protein
MCSRSDAQSADSAGELAFPLRALEVALRRGAGLIRQRQERPFFSGN